MWERVRDLAVQTKIAFLVECKTRNKKRAGNRRGAALTITFYWIRALIVSLVVFAIPTAYARIMVSNWLHKKNTTKKTKSRNS